MTDSRLQPFEFDESDMISPIDSHADPDFAHRRQVEIVRLSQLNLIL